MNETNKVILAAILGIIIGFGFGRFSGNTNVAVAPSTEEAIETQDARREEVLVPATNSDVSKVEAPEIQGQSIKISEEPITIDVKPVATTNAVSQVSKISAVSAVLQGAGKAVTVFASLDRKGWVAVQDDVNGVPGKILGAVHFGPATSSVVVPLMRATVAGGKYLVVLRADDGDFTDFVPSRDLPLLGANGKAIMAELKVN